MDSFEETYWRINKLGQQYDPPPYLKNAFQFLKADQNPSPATTTSSSTSALTSTTSRTKSHDATSNSQSLPASITDPSWQQPQPQTKVPLDIIVIGAGLGGLAAAISLTLSGHKVRVFEQAAAFGEVGAGIQVPPNSTRYLLAWGVGPHIESCISEPYGINLRRWKDGSLLGLTKLRPDFEQKYRAPYWVMHRADYHAALLARAHELGVQITPDSEVLTYAFHDSSVNKDMQQQNGSRGNKPVSVTFKNGKTVTTDLVIGADGVKSLARTTVLVSHALAPIEPHPTYQAAYRCTVPLSVISSNPITKWISDAPNQNLWIGPGRHAMTYPIGGANASHRERLFNLVLSHPEPRPPEQWSLDIDETKAEMRTMFHGFEPRFTEVIAILSSHPQAKVVKWPIVTGFPLPTWRHSSNRLIVLGDAAHAMVPYMSQGAAMAVEDAAAIASVLSYVHTEDDIPRAVAVFEKVRVQRAGDMQLASWLNGEIWHLPDGEVQEARDGALGEEFSNREGWSANLWSDSLCQAWTYGYDAVGEVQEEFKRQTGGGVGC